MAKDSSAEILTVNLDPRNEQLRGKWYNTFVPLDDGSVQVVFALEIIEQIGFTLSSLRRSLSHLYPGRPLANNHSKRDENRKRL